MNGKHGTCIRRPDPRPLLLRLADWMVLGIVAIALVWSPWLGSRPARAQEWSAEYRESLRRTIERRKERSRLVGSRGVGSIVPYPMPPALIIRQTPETHDEIRALLFLLRGGR